MGQPLSIEPLIHYGQGCNDPEALELAHAFAKGFLAGNKRFLDWARRAYEFTVDHGTDHGWYPEFIPQQEYRTEICVVGDMVSTGVWLAQGVSPSCWDHVERTVRNTLARSQFFLTNSFVELFQKIHAGRTAMERAQGTGR